MPYSITLKSGHTRDMPKRKKLAVPLQATFPFRNHAETICGDTYCATLHVIIAARYLEFFSVLPTQ
jgi:hypothetical protein